MTASTTPCCASVPDRPRGRPSILGAAAAHRLAGRARALLRGILLLAALLLACLPFSAQCAEAAIAHAEVVPGDDGYVVNADIDTQLNPRLADAIVHGVPLYFTLEFRIERPRWYWFDEDVVDRVLSYRLSYHALTRNYRLSIGSFHQSFDTLDAAVQTMLRVRNWQVLRTGALDVGESYHAALRFHLDTGQLPKPFQVTAIASHDWTLDTDWLRWTFLAGGPAEQ